MVPLATLLYFEIDFSSSLAIYQWLVSAEFIPLLYDNSMLVLHMEFIIGQPNDTSRKINV